MDEITEMIIGEEPLQKNYFLTMLPLSHPVIVHNVTDFNNRDQLHKAVMALYPHNIPSPNKRETFDILYRIETGQVTPRILVQSSYEIPPDGNGLKTVPMNKLFGTYYSGQRINLTIDINSVQLRKGSRKRIPVPFNEIPEWFTKTIGDAITDTRIIDMNTTMNSHMNGTPIRITRIKAAAEIGNLYSFLQKTQKGIGKAKSYGCGLITALPDA